MGTRTHTQRKKYKKKLCCVTHQRTDGGGLSGTAVTHDHDTTDVGVDDVHDGGELHLLLSDDSAERVHGPGGGVGGLLGGGCG